MALRLKVLSKKVEKFERKGMQNYKVNPERLPTLDTILSDVFAVSRPKPNDYVVRRDLVRIFNEISKEVFAKSVDVPVVVEFGSFVMDLFSSRSDLDLSFNFTSSKAVITRERKIQTLRKLARKFYALQSGGHVYGVHPITTAKVPILKVVDRGTGVECDISIENRDGVLKSQLIQMICSIDERFQKLSFLMKTWAKAQKINSSKDGTLNSLSIILLVAFHLQTRNPPILPPFRALFKDGTDPALVKKLLVKFVNCGRENKESVAELLVSLLKKLQSVEKLWPKGLCASVYEGSWTSKTWGSKVGSISVEDFTDRSQNVSRAVGAAEVKVIYKCIDQSVRHICAFMDGLIEGSRLWEHLFGHAAKLPLAGINAIVPPFPSHLTEANEKRNINVSYQRDLVRPLDSPLTKKMRYTYGSTGNPSGMWGGASLANTLGSTHLPPLELERSAWGMMQMNGWGETQQPAARGWNEPWQPPASYYHSPTYASSSSNQVLPPPFSFPSLHTNAATFGTWPSTANFPSQGTQ